MLNTQGQYCLIRFCPDFSRQEFVNIGVAIYSPETKCVVVKLSPDNRRLTQVFGKQDLHLVKRLKRSIEESLRRQSFGTVEEFQNFIERSANAVRLGPMRPVRITDIEQSLKLLYARLVDEVAPRRPGIYRALKEVLAESGVDSYVQKSVTIDIPSFDQSIRVPYAYQNGRYNLIAPVEFTSEVLSRAGEKAIQGQLLYEQTDPEHGPMHLIVVAKFSKDVPQSARLGVADIFAKHHVGIHDLEDINPLIEDIRQSAVEHGLVNTPYNAPVVPLSR